jgi:predicted transcriptional regulator
MLPISKQSTASYTVLRLILGPLETEVMEVLWTHGESRVREVAQGLGRQIAYTTVMTTLDRLFKKKLVYRKMCDRAYLYSPRVTCQQRRETVVRAVVAKLLAGPQTSRELLLDSLLEAVNQQEPRLLMEVEKKLRSNPLRCDRDTNY